MRAPAAQTTRRRNRQVERALQAEVMLRLKVLGVIAIPVPNSIFIPARTPQEKDLARRIVHQMKLSGMLVPGASDLMVFGPNKTSGIIELKRPAEVTLFGRAPRGKLSADQKEFRNRCQALGVNWVECDSWLSVESALKQWGILA